MSALLTKGYRSELGLTDSRTVTPEFADRLSEIYDDLTGFGLT